MKLLLWYWGRRGGGAQFTLGLAQALARRKDVALTLALSAQNELLDGFRALGAELRLVNTFTDRRSFLAALPRLPAVTADLVTAAGKADVVVSAMTHLWTPLVAPRLRRRGAAFVPVVHDAKPHPGDPAVLWRKRLSLELGAARAAVALSEGVAEELRRLAPGLPLIRMRLLALHATPAKPAPPEAARFVFFGRLRPYKGLDLLRDAFALVRARHPEASLLVVGEGNAEACAPGLAAQPGVTLRDHWVPEREIAALLLTASAVVLPYREASQSGVAPQALALGVPVVATPVGGLTEQVRSGEGGVVATAVTVEALADSMQAVLAPGALNRLRTEAAGAAAQVKDWDGEADRLLAGLDALLSTG